MDKQFIRFRKYYTIKTDIIFQKGDLNVLKWKHKYNIRTKTRWSYINAAIANNHFDVVKWIHRNKKKKFPDDSLQYAAKTGNLEMVKWIYENITYIKKFYINIDDISFSFCKTDVSEVIKWLVNEYDNLSKLYMCEEDLTLKSIGHCLLYGHQDFAKWMIDNCNIVIDLYS